MPITILHKEKLIPGRTSKLILDAPHIARTAKPGHFVMLRVDDDGERFPLTIADTDPENGTITIVYLVMGKSTTMLEELGEGDAILDVCGPLGKATHIEKLPAPKKVVCVGGGTGVAAMHHIAKGHHKAGNYVIACIGARSKDLLLFHDELSQFCNEVLVSTNDGSFGMQGIVTDPLKDRLEKDKNIVEAGRCRTDGGFRGENHGQPQLSDGGRHGDVWRMPRQRGRRNQVYLRGWPGIRRAPGRLCGTEQTAFCVPYSGSRLP